MKHLKKAQQLLQKTKLTPGDWRIIGLALAEGRAANKADKAFGSWRKRNGFGHLSRVQMQQALFLADDAKWTYFKQRGENMQAAMRQWNVEHDTRPMTDRILEVMETKPKSVWSTTEVAAELGTEPRAISDRFSSLRERGLLVSGNKRGTYRLPTKAEAKAPVEKRSGKDDTFSFGKLARITNGLRQALKFRRAGWGHIPSSHDPVTAEGTGKGLAVMTCDTETWSEAITKKARKGTTLLMHGKTYEVDGYAEGYLVRVVIDRVMVPVNTRGETLDEHMEVLKQ